MERRASAQTQLSIVDIGRILARRRFLILGFTVISVCIMAIYGFMKTPVYEGVARLQIDPMRSSSLGLDDPNKSVSPDVDGRLKTEVEIIRSNTVATQVMDSLGLYANPHFAGPDTVSAESRISLNCFRLYAGDCSIDSAATLASVWFRTLKSWRSGFAAPMPFRPLIPPIRLFKNIYNATFRRGSMALRRFRSGSQNKWKKSEIARQFHSRNWRISEGKQSSGQQ